MPRRISETTRLIELRSMSRLKVQDLALSYNVVKRERLSELSHPQLCSLIVDHEVITGKVLAYVFRPRPRPEPTALDVFVSFCQALAKVSGGGRYLRN